MRPPATPSPSRRRRRRSLSRSGQILVNKTLTIRGNGTTNTEVTRSPSAPPFRIFAVAGGANVVLDLLTVTGGSEFLGGGIRNDATLRVTRSVVTGNSATGARGRHLQRGDADRRGQFPQCQPRSPTSTGPGTPPAAPSPARRARSPSPTARSAETGFPVRDPRGRRRHCAPAGPAVRAVQHGRRQRGGGREGHGGGIHMGAGAVTDSVVRTNAAEKVEGIWSGERRDAGPGQDERRPAPPAPPARSVPNGRAHRPQLDHLGQSRRAGVGPLLFSTAQFWSAARPSLPTRRRAGPRVYADASDSTGRRHGGPPEHDRRQPGGRCRLRHRPTRRGHPRSRQQRDVR